MYARATLVEIDVLRTSVAEAAELFRTAVLPGLRERPGYQGSLVLGTDEGRGLLISFWSSQEAAQEGGGEQAYFADLERFVTLFRAPPGREGYEVLVADLPTHDLVS